MNTWISYFIERFNPLFVFALLMGISLSAALIDGHPFLPFPFITSSLALFYIAFLLRLKNDLDDLDKDKVAYPDRFLARGALSKKAAERVAYYLQYAVYLYLALLFLFFGWTARFWLVVVAGYLWWLLKPSSNEERRGNLWVQALLKQGFIFPLIFLAMSMNHPSIVFSQRGVSYAFLMFGALFTYEICRKLDPFSHPISLFPIHYFGFLSVYRVALGLLALTALAAYGMGIPGFLWPFEMAVGVILTSLFRYPERFRWAHRAAGLSLLVHAWAGILANVI